MSTISPDDVIPPEAVQQVLLTPRHLAWAQAYCRDNHVSVKEFCHAALGIFCDLAMHAQHDRDVMQAYVGLFAALLKADPDYAAGMSALLRPRLVTEEVRP
jgi:hypothetical protein